MIRRLKVKFVCINMLIVTVMLGVIFGLVLHFTSRNMEIQSEGFLQSIHETPGRRGPAMRDGRVPYFVVSITPQGILTVTTDAFLGGSNEQMINIAKGIYESGAQQGHLKEQNLRFIRKTMPFGEEIVFVDTSMEQAMMEGLIKTCISIGIVSFLLFFVISVLLANWAVRPVAIAWKNQRQFVADASHELKTPLTVILTNAELMQDVTYAPDEKRQFTDSILTMSHQMRGLVEGLLDLSRVDNGIIKTSFTEVDLSELVCDCLLPFEPMFFERGMELVADVESGLRTKGSQPHLRQVVEILLDNAWKYGYADHPVRVSLGRQGRYTQLCVETRGEEISAYDLKNIFKRFYRVDKARAMNHSYGLGLSIADSIVREHRGKIWAESKAGKNSFYVQIPGSEYRKV